MTELQRRVYLAYARKVWGLPADFETRTDDQLRAMLAEVER